MELQDELQRSKRVLDEKFFEAGKLRDESNVKGDQVVDLRAQVAELERDIDLVKSQRADMFREITRLRELLDMKTKESIDQNDRAKALDYDLQKTHIRLSETEKVIESRSYDINVKSTQLHENEKEIARVKELNNHQSVEIVALRRDVDRVSADCYDLRKGIEGAEGRNVDLSGQIRSQDVQIKDKEENLYAVKKDIENLSYTNTNMRTDLNDYMGEKEALERHSRILLGQNDDLTRELERFVNTDEVLRQQLDRRGRVITIQERQNMDLGYSHGKVYEARSRSPGKKYMPSIPPTFIGTRATAASSYIPLDRSTSPPRRTLAGNASPLRSSYQPGR